MVIVYLYVNNDFISENTNTYTYTLTLNEETDIIFLSGIEPFDENFNISIKYNLFVIYFTRKKLISIYCIILKY
jgi:hypothetical protein